MIVAVCDDNREFLESTESTLKKFSQVEEVQLFTDSKGFTDNYNDDFDLVLVNIDWNEDFYGLQVSDFVHNQNAESKVILMTGAKNMAKLQYIFLETDRMDGVLLKPVDSEVLGQYLLKISESSKSDQRKRLLIKEHGRTISVMFDDIYYLESQNHMIEIYTPQRTFCVYEPLKTLIQRLPDNFCRCHKSFIANMNYIKEFSASKVVIMNGYEFPIGRAFKEGLEQKYEEFAKYVQLEEVR